MNNSFIYHLQCMRFTVNTVDVLVAKEMKKIKLNDGASVAFL